MVARALRGPLAIVVLGLLAEQPLHPYAMRVLIRERGYDRIVRRGPASLYDAVARLTRAGLTEPLETARTGRHPERTVYRITAEGLDSLRSWLSDALAEPERSEELFAALSFMYVLPEAEVIGLLERRAAALAGLIDAADRALASSTRAGVPAIFLSEERYRQALRHAERAWLAELTGQLRSGELQWPRPTA
jgi:DNA-binding PadR family transcriptional regulator